MVASWVNYNLILWGLNNVASKITYGIENLIVVLVVHTNREKKAFVDALVSGCISL